MTIGYRPICIKFIPLRARWISTFQSALANSRTNLLEVVYSGRLYFSKLTIRWSLFGCKFSKDSNHLFFNYPQSRTARVGIGPWSVHRLKLWNWLHISDHRAWTLKLFSGYQIDLKGATLGYPDAKWLPWQIDTVRSQIGDMCVRAQPVVGEGLSAVLAGV